MLISIWKRHTCIRNRGVTLTWLVKFAIAMTLLTIANSSFARVNCSAGPAQEQALPPPSPDEVTPGKYQTIIGTWHELPPQVAAINCSAGSDDAGMTINPDGYQPFATLLNGIMYMTFFTVGDTMTPVFEFRANGGAWTPITTRMEGGFSVSPQYSLQDGESVTIQMRYAWIRVRTLYAGDSARWANQVGDMVWGSPTYSGMLSQNYINAHLAHADIPIPWITCTFDGAGTDHGTDTLSPVDLGSFDASTFAQSAWKSVGIRNVGKCAAPHVYMSFKSGPGYVQLDDYHFGVQMDGTPDPTLGVELQYKDPTNGRAYRISSRGNPDNVLYSPLAFVPPPPGIDYGIQARLVKVGNGLPAMGSSGTSVIVATVNYR